MPNPLPKPTAAAPSYRLWQSPEGVLIQKGGGSIELSVADALALVTDVTALLRRPAKYTRWTPKLSAECVRLYVDEGLGITKIGRRLGISECTVWTWLKKASVQTRKSAVGTLMQKRALADKSARRVA